MSSRLMNPRFALLIAVAAGLLLMAAAPAAFAKDKIEPAPQWALDAAKIATPGTVGDAKAVILFDEYLITFDEQNNAVERERSAVRILKQQGREDAQCAIDYDVDEKLNYFRSWTLTSDGKQFQAMESDFTDRGAYSDAVMQFTERLRILKPPASDPGSVIVCET